MDRLFQYGQLPIDPLTGQPTLTPPRRKPLPIQPGTAAANLAIPSTGQIQERIPTARDRLRTALSTADPLMQSTFGKGTEDIATALEFSPVGVATAAYDLPQQTRELAREPSGRTALAAGLTAASLIPAFKGINRLSSAAAREAPSTARMFLGKGSRTADLDALAKAQDLEKKGLQPGDIWRQTGWGRNAGGEWNYRISDIESKFDPEPEIQRRIKTRITNINKRRVGNLQNPLTPAQEQMAEADIRRSGFTTKLHKVFKHPELMKAEPELFKAQKFVVEPRSKQSTYQAYANPAKKEIGLAHSTFLDPEEARSSILHELDHAVAEASGFPVGSSPTMYAKGIDRSEKAAMALATREKINGFPGATWEEKVKAQEAQYDAALGRPGAFRDRIANNADVWKLVNRQDIPDDRLRAGAKLYLSNRQELDAAKQLGMEDQVRREIAFKSYKNTAGEAAARNTQATRDLTAEELQLMPPTESTQDLIGTEYGYDVPLDQQLVIDEAALRQSNLPEIYSPEEWKARGGGPSSGAGGPRYQQLAPDMPAARRREGGATNPFFDLSNLERVPDRPQGPMERYDPPRGISPRLQGVLGDKSIQKRIKGIIEQGVQMGGERWYNTEPLRQAFVDELGDTEGQIAYTRYMDYVAATSPRSKVPENVRNASYYYMRERQGLPQPTPLPTKEFPKNPEPYGHMAQDLHRRNAQTVASGGFDIIKNPKPPTFSANLQGNQFPVTVDAHATKLPGMLSKDPRWLETNVREGNKKIGFTNIKPQQLHKGGMSVSDLLKEPTYWAGKPNPNEYGGLENMYQQIAKEVGITPAQAQASAWIAGGKTTGLGSDSSKAFMDFFEERLRLTAQTHGIPMKQALKEFIRGKRPLLGFALTAAGAGEALKNMNKDQQPANPFFEIQ